MTIAKADREIIQTVFGKTAEELSGALSSSEEVPLELKLTGKIYKPDEVEKLKTDNQDIGIEIGYKKVAKAAAVKLEAGEKDPVIIAGKIKTGIETVLEEKYKGQTPSDELKKSQDKTKAAEDKYTVLLGTHEKAQDDLKKAQGDYSTLQVETATKARDNDILSHFPEKMKMDRGDGLLIVKAALETKEVDGVANHKYKGELVTDNLGNPASLKDAVLKVVEDKSWVKGKGKGGEDDKSSAGSMPSNLSDEKAIEYLDKQGIESMSTEGSQMIIKLTKDYKE